MNEWENDDSDILRAFSILTCLSKDSAVLLKLLPKYFNKYKNSVLNFF